MHILVGAAPWVETPGHKAICLQTVFTASPHGPGGRTAVVNGIGVAGERAGHIAPDDFAVAVAVAVVRRRFDFGGSCQRRMTDGSVVGGRRKATDLFWYLHQL
jgi:hypothetical protein